MADSKPIIAITTGDPAGIGPEIALKSAGNDRVRDACRPLLVGDFRILDFFRDRFDLPVALRSVAGVAEAQFSDGVIDVLDVPNLPLDGFEPGVATADCGRAILEYAARAVELALAGQVAAVVAGPQTQKAIRAAGIDFDGYPGYIAARTGTDPDDVFLMLYNDDLRIVHVTLHVSLRAALDLINRERVLKTLRAADRAVRNLGIERPRLAVSGVNPHAGEDGLFGQEEIDHIAPAIEDAVSEGIDAHGPFGADTMYRPQLRRLCGDGARPGPYPGQSIGVRFHRGLHHRHPGILRHRGPWQRRRHRRQGRRRPGRHDRNPGQDGQCGVVLDSTASISRREYRGIRISALN